MGVGSLISHRSAFAWAPPTVDKRPLRVCLLSGSLEYKSDESLTAFQKHLEENYNVKCSRAFRKADDDLPGLEHLDDCDVMLLFTRRLTIGGEQLERVKKYVEAGRPIVGVRTASHAFQNWLELDRTVLGGNYKGHYREGPPTEVHFEQAAQKHPICAGVQPFAGVGSLYKNTGIANDCELLLMGTTTDANSPKRGEPIAWTRTHRGGRVFYTSLGHSQDFENDNFRRLLANSLFWAAQREVSPRESEQGARAKP